MIDIIFVICRWISEGLYHDCKDVPTVNVIVPVIEFISGFNQINIEKSVTQGTPTMIDDVKENLKNLKPSNVTDAQMDLIFSDYGY